MSPNELLRQRRQIRRRIRNTVAERRLAERDRVPPRPAEPARAEYAMAAGRG